jgi:beta-galactosidase/beta-glucuronidase
MPNRQPIGSGPAKVASRARIRPQAPRAFADPVPSNWQIHGYGVPLHTNSEYPFAIALIEPKKYVMRIDHRTMGLGGTNS